MNIFLSYPSERINEAYEVYNFLISLDLNVWFDREMLVPGDQWKREIEEAQTRADLVVLICSSETVKKSGTIQKEINRFIELSGEKPMGSLFILSVRVEDIMLPPELSKYQWVDKFQSTWMKNIIKSLSKKFAQLNAVAPDKLKQELEKINPKEFIKQISLSDDTDIMQVDIDYFFYLKESELYWDYINSEIKSYSIGSMYDLRADMIAADSYRKLHSTARVEEFYRRGEFVSLQFFMSLDMGGAHENFSITTKNYNGPVHGKITLGQLFSFDRDVLSYIRDYTILDIKKKLLMVGSDLDISFEEFKDDYELWELFGNFNASSLGITVIINPYVLTPFAFGIHEIHMPWDYFVGRIDPKFAKSPIMAVANAS